MTISAKYTGAIAAWERSTGKKATSTRAQAGDLTALAKLGNVEVTKAARRQAEMGRRMTNLTSVRSRAVRRRSAPRADLATGELWISDEIGYWGITAESFRNELSAVTAPAINVHINSPGGEVFDGIAIFNALVDHPARVTTVVEGLAASIASVIAMAGDEVVMNRHSQLMIHEPHTITMGDAADHERSVHQLNTVGQVLAGIYAENAGGLVDDWRDLMRAETWYTAEAAVTSGLADTARSAEEARMAAGLSRRPVPGRRGGDSFDYGALAALAAAADDPLDALLDLATAPDPPLNLGQQRNRRR